MKRVHLIVAMTILLVATPAGAGDTTRIELTVAGMSCEGCADSVKRGLAELDGVRGVDVDVDERRVVVAIDAGETSREEIEARIADLGYVVGDDDPPVRYPEGADVEVISKKGEAVDVERHLRRGKVTVVDFYAEWCKPCKALDRRLAAHTGKRPDKLAVRKVNVGDWESPVARRYLQEVPGLPYVRIYDPRGRLVVALHGKQVDELDRYLARAWRRR